MLDPMLDPGVHPVGLQSLGQAVGAVITALCALICLAVLVGSFLAERRETGEPSFVTTAARRLAVRVGAPLWAPLPYLTVLGGLALALVGWRAASVGGLVGRFSVDVALIGLTVAALGGLIATTLAHPPRSVVGHVPADVAEPLPAHHRIGERGFGSGPVGAVMVTAGALLAIVTAPVATVWRAVAGTPADASQPAQGVVLTGVAVACLGAWVLYVEGRRPGGTVRLAGLELGEIAGAVTVLAGLSVASDAGVTGVVLTALAIAALVAVRLRAGAGAALAAVVGYVALRLVAGTVVLSFDGMVPLVAPLLAAGALVEVLGLVALPVIRSRRPGGTPDTAAARGSRSVAPLG